MKEKVETLIKTIFGENDEIVINIEDESTNSSSQVITISSSDELKPQLIGKGGRTIKAIHNLVNLVAKKRGERYFVKIKD